MKKIFTGFVAVLWLGLATAIGGGPYQDFADFKLPTSPVQKSYTLTGIIQNPFTNKGLKGVKISLNGEAPKSSVAKGVYKIADIAVGEHKISFSYDEYLSWTGKLIIVEEGIVGVDLVRSDGLGAGFPAIIGENETYKIEVMMIPLLKPIIKGIVTGEDGKAITDGKVKIATTLPESGERIKTVYTDATGAYEVLGFLGTEDKKLKYRVKITHPFYEKEKKSERIEVGATIEKYDEKLKNKTRQQLQQEDLEAMTGFGCSDLMPKYLIGANCQENRELKGDASDVAGWIQKFGGKITSLISFLAVLLIIWNAFRIVIAAGDTDQITQAKKGIMWTLGGLAVTMFAYLIIKTVIMLTYTG